MNINKIKTDYIKYNNQLTKVWGKQKDLAHKLKDILDKEENIEKRKEIIDLVFADKVEEFHEHFFRKTYLKD